ncbi:metal-sulfur cluster assembly factor [Pinisolibacter aquiterrae]|uniref:metal-sulfur cluster assembly factor n=1 Tax=Pinisolibacter aquiterrae TaxID=2815579 RepID=UPI001C3DB7D9|nr:DUF59 domain-containing protein [Pinisolibacter aquiterrae]MCC8235228.1 iron-sulfur cluster assembly protein [Pinisolibacter aquiterrae]
MRNDEISPARRADDALRTLLDPETGVGIVDLGLIYALDVDAAGVATVVMTTTSRGCPAADHLREAVAIRLAAVEGIGRVDVTLTWDPPWTPDRIVRLD